MFWQRKRETAGRMLADAQRLLAAGREAEAAGLYREAWARWGDLTAVYNLGTLYAQGRGVPQDFIQAACCYGKAEERGDLEAGKRKKKCLLDFAHQDLERRTTREIYEALDEFLRQTDPARATKQRLCDTVYDLAAYDLSKGAFDSAASLARAGAEWGGDGRCQNILGVLYNRGAGVEKNDLAALYWFDLAADRGVEAAETDRDGILNAYHRSLSAAKFRTYMGYLADWCAAGTADVAQNSEKAQFWRAKM